MLAKGHVAVGITAYTTGIGLLSFINPTASLGMVSFGLGLGATTLGSILPDIDSPTATISQMRLFKPINQWLSKRFEHRTVTHNTLFAATWFVLAAMTGLHVMWALAWGIFGHIVVDSFSWQGVLWKYPFQKWQYYQSGGQYKKGRRYHKGYQVGGTFEQFVYQCCWVYLSLLMLLAPWIVLMVI